MNHLRDQGKELVGIDKFIQDEVMLDRQILRRFGLAAVRDDIERFMVERRFENRRSLAISISKKSLEMHGKKDIEPFVSKLAEIEVGVQRYNRNLRDHVNHSVYVYLLGLLLMKETNQIDLIDPLSWKIASLLHDVGYPLQLFSSSIREYLDFFQNYKLKKSGFETEVDYSCSLEGLEILKFSDADAFLSIEKLLGKRGIHLNIRSVWQEQLEQGRINHGILSALLVTNWIDSLYEKNNPEHADHKTIDEIDWGRDCFDEQILPAVAAISLHDILDRVESIPLESSPIAYFLVLSDNLQQWNRHQPRRRVIEASSVHIEFENSQIICKLRLPMHRMREIEQTMPILHSQTFEIRIESIPRT